MKKKQYTHPRFYVDIEKVNDLEIASFINNIFSSDGTRKVFKKELISSNAMNDNEEIINDLNSIEYEKLKRYIALQEKMLIVHENKNNYDSVATIRESIHVMIEFEKFFKGGDNV